MTKYYKVIKIYVVRQFKPSIKVHTINHQATRFCEHFLFKVGNMNSSSKYGWKPGHAGSSTRDQKKCLCPLRKEASLGSGRVRKPGI